MRASRRPSVSKSMRLNSYLEATGASLFSKKVCTDFLRTWLSGSMRAGGSGTRGACSTVCGAEAQLESSSSVVMRSVVRRMRGIIVWFIDFCSIGFMAVHTNFECG